MNQPETTNWPNLAIGLYDKLTGRGAEITYEFDDMRVDVPSQTGDGATTARWRINGQLKIHTRDSK
jgi:hypothetical protein